MNNITQHAPNVPGRRNVPRTILGMIKLVRVVTPARRSPSSASDTASLASARAAEQNGGSIVLYQFPQVNSMIADHGATYGQQQNPTVAGDGNTAAREG